MLIVDDEERTREFLKKYVPWEEMGILELSMAKNGQVALELALEFEPDIVLCDVKMPKMDGIEFAKTYRKHDPNCKIIFLSGFSDKEYLKSAIQLKALTYIEKPINLEEVRQAVEDAILLCREEELLSSEQKRLQEHVDRSLPFLRQEMVRKMVKQPQSAHIEQALQSTETFLLPTAGPYTVGVASLHWNASVIPEDPAGVQERMLQELCLIDAAETGGALFGFDTNNWLVFVLPGDYDGSYRKDREVVDRLSRTLRQVIGKDIDFCMGIGVTARTIAEIPRSYEKAFHAGIMQFYQEDRHPFFYHSDIRFGTLEMDWEGIRGLRDELRRGDTRSVCQRIEQHTERALKRKDRDIARVKDTYFQFLLAIMEVAAAQGVTDQTEDAERRYIWREMDAIPSLSKLHAYVLSFLTPFEDKLDDNSSMPSKMREIMRYIHSHFHEKGFTVQAIAYHVNLSETYLCSYFKKQCGQTIKEFINQTRYERAKEMLRERDIKLYEVAIRLGFVDANYFATFFKRYAGCTPSEYRERMAK
nr:response regulator [Paenibacillus phyllosphaerae]